MKINIEIDCTPAEARQFCGLPDLEPMQRRLLADMESRMREAAAKLSPDLITQQWFTSGFEQVRSVWDKVLAARKSPPAAPEG